MVASIRKSKKFKQLASYAIQCLEKVRRMAPPARLRPPAALRARPLVPRLAPAAPTRAAAAPAPQPLNKALNRNTWEMAARAAVDAGGA
jgi:hypothetical protein